MGCRGKAGDELLCYADDYPANVYPWMELARRGVVVRYLEPERPGEITPELVAAALTPRTAWPRWPRAISSPATGSTSMPSGACCANGVCFFPWMPSRRSGRPPLRVDYVDFLSADAHKWMLGPMAIGIVYVRKERFELLRPTLLGAWNVRSPNFITQPEIQFHETAQRYEPGVLNVAGPLRNAGRARAAGGRRPSNACEARLQELKRALAEPLRARGFEFLGPLEGPNASGITTFSHPAVESAALFRALEAGRRDRLAAVRPGRAAVHPRLAAFL